MDALKQSSKNHAKLSVQNQWKNKIQIYLLIINLSSYEGTSHFGVYVEWQKRVMEREKK